VGDGLASLIHLAHTVVGFIVSITMKKSCCSVCLEWMDTHVGVREMTSPSKHTFLKATAINSDTFYTCALFIMVCSFSSAG
jgi:hypothetical protein